MERRARALPVRLGVVPRLDHRGAPALAPPIDMVGDAAAAARAGRAVAIAARWPALAFARAAGLLRAGGSPRATSTSTTAALFFRWASSTRSCRSRRSRSGLYALADARAALRALRSAEARAMIELMLVDPRGVVRRAVRSGRRSTRRWGSPASRSSLIAGIPGIVIPQKVAMAANSFPLLAAPLFILMGNLMNSSGISLRIFEFAKARRRLDARRAVPGEHRRLGDLRGHERLGGRRRGRARHRRDRGDEAEGYDAETAGAITAASATIGPIIPPSLPMIVYGVTAETSIGALFLAGVIPGLLMAVRADADGSPSRDPPQPAAPSVRGRRALWRRVPPRVLGADGAGRAVRRLVLGRVHADRGGGGRGGLRAGARPLRLSRVHAGRTCRSSSSTPSRRRAS